MRISIAADHAGFPLKQELVQWLSGSEHQVEDLGAFAIQPDDDYPDWALRVAEAVASGRSARGIVVCGSGVGACVAANKVPGVRACMCHDTYSARQGVEHDDMNLLCLGGRVIGIEVAKGVVHAFLSAHFTGEERHRRRLNKLLAIEARALAGKPGEG